MNTVGEDFFFTAPLFICERFSRHSLAILPNTFCGAFKRIFIENLVLFMWQFKASLPYPGWLGPAWSGAGSPQLLGELFPASMTLQQ